MIREEERNPEYILQESEGFFASGEWLAENAKALNIVRANFSGKQLNLSRLAKIDTFGVVLLLYLRRTKGVALVGIPSHYRALFKMVARGLDAPPLPPPKEDPFYLRAFALITAFSQVIVVDFFAFLNLLGEIGLAIARNVMGKSRFQFYAFVQQLELIAFKAVPIVLLITFLIGAIITQQGIFHFRSFGADIFVVDMVGVLTLREVGVLFVCILIAGRTGSAYTAEIGAMNIREEVDALRVMGLNPIDMLVIPRVFAMIIGLPLLTILGDFSAMFGGIVVAQIYGDISPETFLNRFQEVVNVRHFWVGVVKAPFMALVIGLIACIEGMRVSGSAQSLGLHTTASVVKSIFMVIVMNGFFALFFALLGV